MIRVATLDDVPELVALQVQMVEETTPYLLADKERIREFTVECISAKSALVLIAEGAALIAVEAPFIWQAKRNTQIMVLWADDALKYDALVEGFMAWWQKRRGSLIACYMSPAITGADNSLLDAGFKHEGTMLVRQRYGRI